jgi:hypothetical protein
LISTELWVDQHKKYVNFELSGDEAKVAKEDFSGYGHGKERR